MHTKKKCISLNWEIMPESISQRKLLMNITLIESYFKNKFTC